MMPKRQDLKSSSESESKEPCQGVRPGGGRCDARRITGSSYCFFHDPEMEVERKAAQSAGGQKNKLAVLPNSTPDAKLDSAEDAIKLIGETINQVLRGEIDPKIGNTVGYLSGLLVRVQRDVETERRLASLESAIKRQNAHTDFTADEQDDSEWIPPGRKNDDEQ
jgi:hypothetical protein